MNIYSALWLLLAVMLAGCQTQPAADDPVQPREFSLRDVAKGDVDMVAEVSQRQAGQYLRELAIKLYKRNPDQLKAAGAASGNLEEAAARLTQSRLDLPGLQGKRGAEAISLAFNSDYAGDRVAAFVYGLHSMMVDAYGGEGEFFLSSEFDPQKLYYLARNFEIAAWRLRNERGRDGNIMLLSSGADSKGVFNHSFERLFGKLIALHDHLAYVIADTTNRRIKNVIQGVASAVFFPI